MKKSSAESEKGGLKGEQESRRDEAVRREVESGPSSIRGRRKGSRYQSHTEGGGKGEKSEGKSKTKGPKKNRLVGGRKRDEKRHHGKQREKRRRKLVENARGQPSPAGVKVK